MKCILNIWSPNSFVFFQTGSSINFTLFAIFLQISLTSAIINHATLLVFLSHMFKNRSVIVVFVLQICAHVVILSGWKSLWNSLKSLKYSIEWLKIARYNKNGTVHQIDKRLLAGQRRHAKSALAPGTKTVLPQWTCKRKVPPRHFQQLVNPRSQAERTCPL